ncbi:hypothetical protein HDU93_006592 [Gonapodya sp. JEL0774]|nr:hypothetical protein HDU93_006592 [Gonapodya sp. JEL0774]
MVAVEKVDQPRTVVAMRTLLIDGPTPEVDEASIVAKMAIRSAALGKSVFVAAPYLVQITNIRKALNMLISGEDTLDIRVDTPERLQGGEADIVFVAYAFLATRMGNSPSEKELSFLFSRPKLNVAISRAREHCTLILPASLHRSVGSPLPLTPAVAGGGQDIEEGWTFICEYIRRSVTERFVPSELHVPVRSESMIQHTGANESICRDSHTRINVNKDVFAVLDELDALL